MSDYPSSEMTLEECMAVFPPTHRARKEYEALKARPVEAQAEAGELDLAEKVFDFLNLHIDRIEADLELHEIATQIVALARPVEEGLREAFEKMRDASFQDHSSHWDSTMQHGAGCSECRRATELRNEAQTMWDATLTRRERNIT